MPRSNIVLFCADQMRADSLRCTGNTVVRTPNIDAIAASGTNFVQHRTPHQICSPSRATMFTGLYPRNHKLYKNGNALPSDKPVLPATLADAGYRTHGVGNFHLQPLLADAKHEMPDSIAFWNGEGAHAWRGPFYGFQTVDTLLGEAHHCLLGGHYAEWFKKKNGKNSDLYEPSRSLSAVPDDLPEVWKCAVPHEQHYNRWIADRACDFVKSQAQEEEPFFLYVSFPDPHHPFSPPEPYCDRYSPDEVEMPKVQPGELDRMPPYLHKIEGDEWLEDAFDDYAAPPAGSIEQGMLIRTDDISEETIRQAIAHTYGMVEMIDDCVGLVLKALKDAGLSGDTIICFTVDHGEFLGDHGLLRKGAPPYDQLVRIPMVMSGPGVPQAREIDTKTSHIDLYSTFCDLTGTVAAENDGLTLTPLLRGGEWTRDTLFGEFYPRAHWNEVNHSIFHDQWRLTLYPEEPGWGELFDHRTDPGEHRNLYYVEAYRDVVVRLSERLLAEFPIFSTSDAPVYGTY